MAEERYSNPKRFCDIVMKGGITSGVVYPPAACELAQIYRFKNIGGTSAGAIAAAALAAAEYGRNHGTGESFPELEKLPHWLGQLSETEDGSNLFSLFQPQERTRPIFGILAAGIGKGWGLLRALNVALDAFPEAWLGALPGLILFGLACFYERGSMALVWGLLSLLFVVIGLAVSTGSVVLWNALKRLPESLYGLCSGNLEQPFQSRDQSLMPDGPLTPWLARYLDRLAGKPKDQPITFGDLWGAPDRDVGERDTNLEMMTTCITLGRPYRIPFETEIFYFNLAEFEWLFPEYVVTWMKEHPRVSDKPDQFAALGLHRLPSMADLPVVVAARMSLSFPILISAVPLYAIDYSRRVKSEDERRPERCWFSDGGICSNFPVHFFDVPLPRWPTFAINLRPPHPDYPDALVRMAQRNSDGIIEGWMRFDDAKKGSEKLTGFLTAILNAMQNWADNSQTQLPGYRDRVVHVSLKPDEGGLNLNMDDKLIGPLSDRGRAAAQELISRFAMPNRESELNWENHRWVRYRTTMALVEGMMKMYSTAFDFPMEGDRSYASLIAREPNEPPGAYRWTKQQKEFAVHITEAMLELTEHWKQAKSNFSDIAPKPNAELRIRPRI
jgi:Patatin-like phospholipase